MSWSDTTMTLCVVLTSFSGGLYDQQLKRADGTLTDTFAFFYL